MLLIYIYILILSVWYYWVFPSLICFTTEPGNVGMSLKWDTKAE